MKGLAEGDLTQTIDKNYEGSFADLKEYANGTVLKLSTIIGEVNSAADALAGRRRGSQHDLAVAFAGGQ